MSGLFDVERLADLAAARPGLSTARFTFAAAPRRALLLRHDVDLSVAAAGRFGALLGRRGLLGTYFFRLRAPGYNLAEPATADVLRALAAAGHAIGLHLDVPPEASAADLPAIARGEHERFAALLPSEVDPAAVISIHRPPAWSLRLPFERPLENAYADPYFDVAGTAYQSDSDGRFDWLAFETRIADPGWERFQLLLHPEWWAIPAARREDVFHALVRENAARYGRWLAEEINAFADFAPRE